MSGEQCDQAGLRNFDTCRGSVLHLLCTREPRQSGTGIRFGLLAWPLIALVSFGPLFLVLFLREPTRFFGDGGNSIKVPFVLDGCTIWQLLVTFPILTTFLLYERHLLADRLCRLIRGGVLVASTSAIESYRKWWESCFRWINIVGTIVAALAAAGIAYANYRIFGKPDWGSWQAVKGNFGLSGTIWLFWIFMFYFVSFFYSVRAVGIYFLIRDATKSLEVKLLPFHPDRCGGLKSVGIIGVRNQFVLAAAGINLVLLVFVIQRLEGSLAVDSRIVWLLLAAVAFYVVIGPVAFLGPLLPFRVSMAAAKYSLVKKVGAALQAHYTKCFDSLPTGGPSTEDHKVLQRINALMDRVRQIPVWPFDIRTIRQFAAAYFVPFVSILASLLLGLLTKTLAN